MILARVSDNVADIGYVSICPFVCGCTLQQHSNLYIVS